MMCTLYFPPDIIFLLVIIHYLEHAPLLTSFKFKYTRALKLFPFNRFNPQ